VLPPAAALCAIEEQAVPKLRTALLSQDTANDHGLIASALYTIGGESAAEALKSAYKTEKDAYTRDYLIKRLIDSMRYKN
jgi:HEAT repeat protein